MKKSSKIMISISSVIMLICLLFLLFRFEINRSMPDVFYATSLEDISIDTFVPFIKLKIETNKNCVPVISNKTNKTNKYNCKLTSFGIPLKFVELDVVERRNVTPYGVPFGAKIFINGVIIVKTASVETEMGDINPTKIASVQKGDIITHVDDITVNSNEELSKIISKSNGKKLKLKVLRDNYKIDLNITPVKSLKENTFRLGIWVRDSSAGIGTITFCDEKGNFAGLGHAIKDLDTDKIIPLSHGEIVKASIKSVLKPSKNSTGELRGNFLGDETIGTIDSNNSTGVYGKMISNAVKSKFSSLKVSMKQEVKVGPAKIISTVEGTEPDIYDIRIDKVSFDKRDQNKNISITICDKKLIEKTGGVVQGMSGSPIIQGGMLVGAVTHVVADNPLKGYGIFAETMVNNCIFD